MAEGDVTPSRRDSALLRRLESWLAMICLCDCVRAVGVLGTGWVWGASADCMQGALRGRLRVRHWRRWDLPSAAWPWSRPHPVPMAMLWWGVGGTSSRHNHHTDAHTITDPNPKPNLKPGTNCTQQNPSPTLLAPPSVPPPAQSRSVPATYQVRHAAQPSPCTPPPFCGGVPGCPLNQLCTPPCL